MKLVDSHCHLDMLDLTADAGQLDAVIQRAQAQGVCHFLNVSVNLTDFPTVLKTAERYPFVSASVGVHPNERDEPEVTREQLLTLASHPKVIAIGETGLDYFRSMGDLEWQRDRFRLHIAVAKELNKPLIIHTRQAKEDTLRIMAESGVESCGGVMHCFSEDWETAKLALDLGFYISFSGVVTFKNTAALQEVAKLMPADRILVETDAPYLAPMPHRGKHNEPGYVRLTAEYIAQLRGDDFAGFADQTTSNFFQLFKGAKHTHV